jgi:hypothetical protein
MGSTPDQEVAGVYLSLMVQYIQNPEKTDFVGSFCKTRHIKNWTFRGARTARALQ